MHPALLGCPIMADLVARHRPPAIEPQPPFPALVDAIVSQQISGKAEVTSSYVIDESTKAVRALVPDYQLSLAIGKEGQNARLAAKLTGARIDIQPDSILED